MKVSNSRRAHRYFDVVRNPHDHWNDPVPPKEPGPSHAYLFDPRNPRPAQAWILKHASSPAFLQDGAETAACGMGVRTIYPEPFDTDGVGACPRCAEMALLRQTDPVEFQRRLTERQERWHERDNRRWKAVDLADLKRQESYGSQPIPEEEEPL
ncbi:hypothetical protein [Mycobacterium sp.]|uniref:hypothetical protein n=1 Tax=Mycobacterium sp. TaxID=1785 RepID=UPI00121E2532|nr:hypothetical protein [Mycobacterium sp.]TAM64959.1 MAG: hypothetical protein EPN51_21620 [Mycobacterium sp.]